MCAVVCVCLCVSGSARGPGGRLSLGWGRGAVRNGAPRDLVAQVQRGGCGWELVSAP